MKTEIAEAVSFLISMVKLKDTMDQEKRDLFAERLTVALEEKFEGHWYPENPSKGQGYRCVTMTLSRKNDLELLRACRESGIHYSDLGLPLEFTLWVDPGEVSSRYGEEGSIFPVTLHNAEKSTHSSPLTVHNRKCSNETMNPDAPAWFSTPPPLEKAPLNNIENVSM